MKADFFKNKTVWLTGASSGIGEQIAYQLAEKGARLILSSAPKDDLEKVQIKCEKFGAYCFLIKFDLGDRAEVLKATDEVIEKFTCIDILINNGGVSQRSLAKETSEEMIRKLMEINYFSHVLITQKMLPSMILNGGGNIAVTSSISGKFGFPLRSIYASAKHALHGYFETLLFELKEHNIKVSILCPGRVRTNISLNAFISEDKRHGEMDPGQANGISPESCAKKYLNAIRKGKKEVLIGGKELNMVYLKRFFPGLFYFAASKIQAK